MKNIIVIYHANCPDGFGGAWAAWKKFKNKADYFATQHHKPVLEGLKGKEIYFIDLSYSTDVIKELIKNNKRVTTIDHHITAKAAVLITKDYSFDINHSGAVLAWKYFHPNKPMPKLLKHIEDIDLWRFKIPNTKEVINALDLLDFNFKTWEKMAKMIEQNKSKKIIVEKGKVITDYEDSLVNKLLEGYTEKVDFLGHQVLAVNCPNFLASEVGSALVKKMPPIGIVWSRKDGRIIVSLRSDGKADVAEIAQKFGGGGHKAASGFSLEANQPLPWTPLETK